MSHDYAYFKHYDSHLTVFAGKKNHHMIRSNIQTDLKNIDSVHGRMVIARLGSNDIFYFLFTTCFPVTIRSDEAELDFRRILRRLAHFRF